VGEYRAAHPDGYNYRRFSYRYQRWKRERDVVLRQRHRPGENLFVDWAGTAILIYDPRTGEVRQASLFVAVLGACNYTHTEASENQQIVAWIRAHVCAFAFLSRCRSR
jgi:transposase